MARIKGIESNRAPLAVRVIYRFARRRPGRVPEGMKIRAHDPRLLRQWLRMDTYVESKGKVTARLKRLAMLKTAMPVGCPF